MRLDLKENIVFPFSDPSWVVKTLIGSACQLLGFTVPALVGYQLSIIRQTANGEDEKLPEFENFGTLWMRGLVVTVVLCVLLMVPSAVMVGMIVSGAVAFGEESNGVAMMAVVGLGILFLCLASLALMFLVPAMMLRYAMTEQMSSFFDFTTAIGDIKQGFTDYLLIVLFPIVTSMLLMTLGMFTFGLGFIVVIPASVLVMFIQARMIGNYYRAYFM